MKQWGIILLFLYPLYSFGQDIEKLDTILTQKQYTKVIAFLGKVIRKPTDGPRSSYEFEIDHQIVDSFSIAVIEFEECYPDKGEKEIYLHMFRLSLLLNGDKIFYCKVENHSSLNSVPTKLLEYSSDKEVRQLGITYNALFGFTPELNDYFYNQKDFVYGSHCGFVGIDPDKKKILDSLIVKKNYAELDRWLCSPIAELQIYAVEGFYKLKGTGYFLTVSEKKWIALIKAKKGSIANCSGCNFGIESIEEATKDFSF